MRRLSSLNERAAGRSAEPSSFTLSIELGNEAMQTGEDAARALREVATGLDQGYDKGRIVDDNGNAVGKWSLK